MSEFYNYFTGLMIMLLGLDPEILHKLLSSTLLFIVFLGVQRLSRFFIRKKIKNLTLRYQWTRFSAYSVTAVALLLIGRGWFQGITSIITYLGILSAGLAIAFQDVLKNFAGWIFILWRKPFDIGDRVEIGKFAGDVIDLRIFQFTLLEIGNWVKSDQSTGRIIHIPNGMVFTDPLFNFYSGFAYIWSEVSVLITFESSWKKAKKILQEIADKKALHLTESAQKKIRAASQKYLIFYNKLTPIVYTSVEESGVNLTLRFLCEPRKRRIAEEEIWEDVLESFSKCSDIDFAYPTVRYYSNPEEGKKPKRSSKRK